MISSSGNEMFVTFSSGHFVDIGFFAKISQTSPDDRDPMATFCTITNPCRVNEGHCYNDQQCGKGLKCGQNKCPHSMGYSNKVSCCYEHCNSWSDLATGVLTSPNYPYEYPQEIECAWTITAPQQGQIITVQFVDFEVSSIFNYDKLLNIKGVCYGCPLDSLFSFST